MKETGIMIKLMGEAHIFIWMVQNIMVIGKKINNMGMVLKHGLMVLSMRVIMNMGKNMEPVLSSGPMGPCILENSIIIISMGRESTPGATAVSMKANGATIKCMARVHLRGLMVENMWVSTSTTRNRAMESSFGQTADHIKETGLMVNSMEKVYMLHHKGLKSMANGKKERELNGLVQMIMIECVRVEATIRII